MKNLACLLLLGVLALPVFATTTVRHHARSISGQYMVLLDTNIPAAAYDGIVKSLASTYGLQIRTEWREEPRGFVATVPVTGAERLVTDARVRIVEEDFPISFPTESGSQWTSWNGNYLWFLDRLDETTYADNVRDSTYDMCPEGRTVNAYIIDNGARGDHQQFTYNGEPAGRVEALNFAFGAQGTPDGLNGCEAHSDMWHGTAVATVLGGTTTGASKAHIVSLRVVDCDNHGYASDMVSAVNWIRGANDPHRFQKGVVNMSRFFGDWTSDFATLNAAVSGRVDATQIPIFVSANNFSADACKFSPAALAYTNMNHGGKVFSVGGTSVGAGGDTNDYRWQTWSATNPSQILIGQDTGSNGGACISIYAPAADIYVGLNTSTTAYDIKSGTSFSAPLAAAIALRYIELTGNNAYQQVFDYLLSTAGPSTLINHVETPEYWMCLSLTSGQYLTYTSYPGACSTGYGQDGTVGGEPIHFNATSNTSAAGMLHSAMTCP